MHDMTIPVTIGIIKRWIGWFKKLQLICCHLSGVAFLAEEFQKGLQALSCDHGAMERKNNTVNIFAKMAHILCLTGD